MSRINEKTNWEKVRDAFQTVHLWLGLIGGLFIFVICLTGTIYTFADDIKKALNPGIYSVEASGQKKPISELEQAVQQNVQKKITGAIIPDAADEPYVFMYQKEGERRPSQVRINPYTADILTTNGEERGAEFLQVVFKLHRWLLLDSKIGRPIVGVCTIIFAIGCITGMVIWVPRRVKNWKQGFKIKTGNWKRLNHDLHNALGFYSFIFILVMALTGLVWSFEWYKEGYNTVLGASHLNVKKDANSDKPAKDQTKPKTDQPSPDSVRQFVNWDDIIKMSSSYFPYQGNLRISLAKKPSDAITITKEGTSFWAYSNSDELKLKSSNLEVEKFEKYTDQPIGHQIAKSYKSIHMGYIFGTGSKIIYFISCLIATSLPVTGVIIYINNLKKKRHKKAKKLSQN